MASGVSFCSGDGHTWDDGGCQLYAEGLAARAQRIATTGMHHAWWVNPLWVVLCVC